MKNFVCFFVLATVAARAHAHVSGEHFHEYWLSSPLFWLGLVIASVALYGKLRRAQAKKARRKH